MDDDIHSLLRELGLDEKEIAVYLHLVRNGRLSAYRIAKETHLPRPNCYNVLDRLASKGFVSAEAAGEKRLYACNDLSNVLGMIKNRESLLLSLMPRIERLESEEETSVRYLDAKGAFAQFDTRLYSLAMSRRLSFFYMIGNSPDLTTRSSDILIRRLLSEMAEAKALLAVDGRAIWDERFRGNPFMEQFARLGKNRFLSGLPSRSTTFIYDGHVSFVFLDARERLVEIRSERIVGEMKAYFSFLWKTAKR